MDESTGTKTRVMGKVQQAVRGIAELAKGWTVLVVREQDQQNWHDARKEIRANCKILFSRPGFDNNSTEGQILLAVLDYFDGEEKEGL